jgi:general secretion pathway protein D
MRHILAAFICTLVVGHGVLSPVPARAQGNVPGGGQSGDLTQPQPVPPGYKEQIEREAAQAGMPPPVPGKITPQAEMPPPAPSQRQSGKSPRAPEGAPGMGAPPTAPGMTSSVPVPMGQPSTPGLQGVPQAAPVTPAAPMPPLKPGEMLFNFQDADINALVKTMSQITNRNFLIDPRVKGKVTIISSKPVQKEAAYQIFLSALKAQGFSAVEGPGGIIKIIPEAEAKQGAWLSTDDPARSDLWITHVVALQNVSASQMVQLLRPMMSPHALISPYTPTNTLIITDTAASIRNILKVLDQIDKASSGEVTVIPLQHASASDIAQLISRLDAGSGAVAPTPGQVVIPGQAGGDLRFILIPDARTNSLLVRGDNLGRIEQLRSLVAKLDVPARLGGNTRVVSLRNAEAVKLAEILRGLLAGEARAATTTSALPAAAPSGLPGAVPTSAAAAPRPIAASLIQADEATNSLIISASDADYNNLRAVIDRLDVRRAQVFIEALIAEVSAEKAAQFGIQWAGATPSGPGATAGIVNYPGKPGIIESIVDPTGVLGAAAGITVGFLGKKVILPDGTEVFGLGALARALEEKNDLNILSTPNLLTLDNVEAKIVIGQNVPFLTGSFTSTATTGGTVNPFQTIERKDVGLTLKIKPQISEGGGVKMQISQEVSSVVRTPTAGAADLVTNKRSIDTTVIADDGNIVVLGGLIEEQVTENVQAVPLLSKLPLIGDLFTFRDRSRKKTNLMVFLRPVIVRSGDDMLGFTQDRYESMRLREQKSAMDRNLILPRFAPPTLPEFYQPPPKPVPEPKEEAPAKDVKPIEAPVTAAPVAPMPVETPPAAAPEAVAPVEPVEAPKPTPTLKEAPPLPPPPPGPAELLGPPPGDAVVPAEKPGDVMPPDARTGEPARTPAPPPGMAAPARP